MLGVDVIAPYDKDKIRVNAKVGGFDLQAFRLPHGEICSYGVLIRHDTGDTTLFMTDYEYTEYVFKACKVNHFLIECNYQPEYVDLDKGNKSHKLGGHQSIDTCRRFLKVNQTPYMSNVMLIHMGKDSTNPKECVADISKALGGDVNVTYAKSNTAYDFKRKGV